MLLKGASPLDNYDDFFNISENQPSPPFFIPRTDHNINMFLKKNVHKFIYISLPNNENKDENQVKEESDLCLNKTLKSENLFKIITNESEDEINSSISLDESEEFDQINSGKKINSINQKYSDIVISLDPASDLKTKLKPKKIFVAVYPRKISLFTDSKIEFDFFEANKDVELIGNKRRRNKEDDIRRMIGRRFFNDIILKLINAILEKAGSIIIFEKIQQDVVYDLVKKSNKKMLDMTLEQIFIEKEIYRGKKMEKYNHNLKLIKLIKSDAYKDIRENTQIDKILDIKYYDLYKEYLSSNEFIEEINRLKNNKKFDEAYIANYIYYSLHFIENFLD